MASYSFYIARVPRTSTGLQLRELPALSTPQSPDFMSQLCPLSYFFLTKHSCLTRKRRGNPRRLGGGSQS